MRADGTVLRWRMAGIETSREEPSLPFFIEWGLGTPYPGAASAQHRIGAPKIDELRMAGDPDRLERWLGGAQLPIAICEGAPALDSVILSAGEVQVVLDRSL
jgi:hypothetical protein